MCDIDGLSYVYHSTAATTLLKIRDAGVRPSGSSSRDGFEEKMVEFASKEELLLPVTRQDCSFFHPTIEQAIDMTAFDLTGTGDSPELQLVDRQGIAVIDLRCVETVPYVGDFQIFSDIIDLRFMDQPDEAVVSESYEDALRTYIKTLRPLTAFDSIEQLDEQYHLPEILIEGGVSQSTIVEILFRKLIQKKLTIL